MGDRFDVPVEGDDFRLDADLLHKLAGESGGERLADLDPAAGQAEMSDQRRPSATDDEDPAFSKHRRRNREDGARGKLPVIHGAPPGPSRFCTTRYRA
jgi:hypothetical protein